MKHLSVNMSFPLRRSVECLEELKSLFLKLPQRPCLG